MTCQSKNDYRSWISTLYRPTVVVITTERAREDFVWASQAAYTRLNCFSSALEQFSTLQDNVAISSYPKNIVSRVGDQKGRNSVDIAAHFIEPQVSWSYIEAHEHLIGLVSQKPPPASQLQLRQKIHPFYRKQSQSSVRETIENASLSSTQCLESTYSNVTNDNPMEDLVVSYPHHSIRQTDTYIKAKYDDCRTYVACSDELIAYDLFCLRLLRKSFLSNNVDRFSDMWFKIWIKEYSRVLDAYEDNTLTLPYALIYFVSSRDEDPVAAIQGLMESASSISRSLPEMNTGRCFVVVNREENTKNSDSGNSALNAIKEAYPPSSCHSFPLCLCSKFETFLIENQGAIQQLALVVTQHTLLPTLERLSKRLAEYMTHQTGGLRNQLRSLWTRGTRGLRTNRFFPDHAIENTAEVIWGSYASGLKSRLSFRSKETNGSGTGNYLITEGDSQNLAGDIAWKMLGDILFFLGDYVQAASAYRNAAAEFRHLKYVKQQAQALELFGICLSLSPKSTKTELEPIFSEAISLFRSIQSIRSALRSQIIYCRAILALDDIQFSSEVAVKYQAIAFETLPELDSKGLGIQEKKFFALERYLRSAVLLEQAAATFKLNETKNLRKTLFFSILAGHSYSKSGLESHAIACYSLALPYLGDSRWYCISDHILFSLARQSWSIGLLADSVLFFLHLIENLVLQSVDNTDKYTLPLYSRLTTFNRNVFSDLLPDSFTIPRSSTLLKPSFILNPNRETTYIREALSIFRMWYSKVNDAFSSLPSSVEKQYCLDAFHRLAYELPLPCLHNHFDIRLESQPDVSQVQCFLSLDKILSDLKENLKLEFSIMEYNELLMLLGKQSIDISISPFQRTVAIQETIKIVAKLYNPLLIGVECHNLRVVCSLNNSRESTASKFLPSESDSSIVFCESLTLFMKPQEEKTVTIKIVPQQQGYLRIDGLAWDLYNLIKVFIPFHSSGALKPRRRIQSYLVSRHELLDKVISPEYIPCDNQLLHSFVDSPAHDEPLSPLNSSSSPLVLLNRAFFVAQLLSTKGYREQKALLHHTKTCGMLQVSQSYPRLGFRWSSWPSTLYVGERRSLELALTNLGNVDITMIRIQCVYKGFCFFPGDQSISTCLEFPHIVQPGQQVVVPVILRGSSMGCHNLMFFVAADFFPSVKENAAPLSLSSSHRRWFALHQTLQVNELLHIDAVHHLSSSSITGFTGLLLFKSLPHRSHEDESPVTITKVQCYLPKMLDPLPLTLIGLREPNKFDPFAVTPGSPVQVVFSFEYVHPSCFPIQRENPSASLGNKLESTLLQCSREAKIQSSNTSASLTTMNFYKHLDSFSVYGSNTIGDGVSSFVLGNEVRVDYVICWTKGDYCGESILLDKGLLPNASLSLRCQIFFPPSPLKSGLVLRMKKSLENGTLQQPWVIQHAHLFLYNLSFTDAYSVFLHIQSESLPLWSVSPSDSDLLVLQATDSKTALLTNALSENLTTNAFQSISPKIPLSNQNFSSESPVCSPTFYDTNIQYNKMYFLGSSAQKSIILNPGDIHVVELLVWLPGTGLYNLGSEDSIQIRAALYDMQSHTTQEKEFVMRLSHAALIYYTED